MFCAGRNIFFAKLLTFARAFGIIIAYDDVNSVNIGKSGRGKVEA